MEKNRADPLRSRWTLALAAVLFAALAVVVPSVDADGDAGGTGQDAVYGSVVSPYGGMYADWDSLDDGGTYYLAMDSPVIIRFGDSDFQGLEDSLENTGLSYSQDDHSISGNLGTDISITSDGKTVHLRGAEATMYGDLPIYGGNVQERDFEGGDYPDAKYKTYYEQTIVICSQSGIATPQSCEYTVTLDGESFSSYGLSIGVGDWEYENNKWSLSATLNGTPTKTITKGEIRASYTVSSFGNTTEYVFISHITVKGLIITYDDGGIYGQASKTQDEWSEGFFLKLPSVTVSDPTKIFTGWYTQKSGGNFAGIGGATIPNADVVFERDTTLYAVYTDAPNPVKDITLTGDNTVKVGEWSKVTATTVMTNDNTVPDEQRYVTWSIRSGEEFVNYSTFNLSTGGSISVQGIKPGVVTFEVTSYGQQVSKTWTMSVTASQSVQTYNYTVSYVMDGGTPTIPDDSFSSQNTSYEYTVTSTEPSKSGYTFLGWSRGAPDKENLLHGGNKIVISYDMPTVLYANWEKDVNEFILSFYDNAGVNKVLNDLVETDSSPTSHGFTIPNDRPIMTGYDFNGWATEPNSSMVKYGPGGHLNAKERETRLYAVFKAISDETIFKVVFDPTFGSGGPTEFETLSTGLSYRFQIPQNEPIRPGWEFMGWSNFINGDPIYKKNGENGLSGSIDLYKGTTVLYAIWKPVEVTLEFNSNGGSGKEPTIISGAPTNYVVTIPQSSDLTREGYVLNGWSEKPDGSGAQYMPGQQLTVSKSVVLYAVWIPVDEVEYRLSFVSKTGTDNLPGDKVNKDGSKEFTIPSTRPSYDGLTFKGWSTVEGVTTPNYYPGDKITVTAPTTKLFAVWAVDTEMGVWSVTFDPNGGSGAPGPLYMVVTGGVWEFTIPVGEPTYPEAGFIFMGWSTLRDTQNKDNLPKAGDTYTSTMSELTLYAIWEKGTKYTVTVTYHLNGGSGDVPSGQKLDCYGSASISIPAEPTPKAPSGAVFSGWCERSDGTGTIYAAGDTFEKTVSGSVGIDLYAIYTAIEGNCTFTIEYRFSDDSFIDRATVDSDTGVAEFRLLGVERLDLDKGMVFKHWSKTKNGPAVSSEDGVFRTINQNTILFAVLEGTSSDAPHIDWEITADGLTVTFDASGCRNYSSLKWYLPGGVTYGEKTFDYTFGSSGSYAIKLVMIGYDGAEYVKEETIHVSSSANSYAVYVALAFGVVLVLAVLRIQGVF